MCGTDPCPRRSSGTQTLPGSGTVFFTIVTLSHSSRRVNYARRAVLVIFAYDSQRP